jgi:WD40 repeat protein
LADGTARIWDAATGTESAMLTDHLTAVNVVAWSPNGSRLASASEDGTARIWDAATGTPSAVLTGHTGPVYGVVWSPNGSRVATASADGTARARSQPSAWPEQLCARAGRNLNLDEWVALLGDIPYK